MRRYRINKRLSSKYPKFSIPYGSTKVDVPYPENPSEGKCDACGQSERAGQIETTILGHWKLAYRTPTFKKEPWKALENMNELCMNDHKIRIALKNLLKHKEEEYWRVVRTALLMPEEMKRRFDRIARAWLMSRKKDKSRRSDLRNYFEKR